MNEDFDEDFDGDEIMSTTLSPPANDPEITTFVWTSHANNIYKKLQTYYEQKDLSDITLIADNDNTSVSAHRIVLSASSDFFHAMFRSSLKEAKATEVTIKDIDGVTLRTLLNFMYTGSIDLHSETIESILKAADYFQMDALVGACFGFMEERLDASNCLGIAHFAEQHSYIELDKFATSFVLQNFEKVSKENEFVQLSKEQIRKIISSDDLNMQSEETVFLSVLAWVEYDKKNREASTSELLSLVRFTLLEPNFIVKNMVSTRMECHELIESWLEWHNLSPEKRQQSTLKNTQPRKKASQKLAFISGTCSNDLTLQILDPHSNTWSYKKIPKLNVSKKWYGISYISQKIIITGGDIDSKKTNTVECFNLLTNEWTNLCPMGSARSCHEATVAGGSLYVVGGCGIRDSVEKYDFFTNTWQKLEPLPMDLPFISTTALRGHLYAISGVSGEMVCYDSASNKWIPKKTKQTKVDCFGCAEVCGKLYTVGGKVNNHSDYDIVECYDFHKDNWEKKNPLNLERSFAYCTALNDRLIVAGGYDTAYEEFLNLVEEYDPEKKKWTQLARLLTHTPSFTNNLLFTM